MKIPARTSLKIRTGDTVKVMAGIDRGKQGKVTQVFPAEQRIVVEGVNSRKKNLRTRKGTQQQGETIQFNAPFALSNVMLVCPHCSKPTRVGHGMAGDAKKRKCSRCNQLIDA